MSIAAGSGTGAVAEALQRYMKGKISDITGTTTADWKAGEWIAKALNQMPESDASLTEKCQKINQYRPTNLDETTINGLLDEVGKSVKAGTLSEKDAGEIRSLLETVGYTVKTVASVRSAAADLFGSLKGKAAAAKNKAKELGARAAEAIKGETTELLRRTEALTEGDTLNKYTHSWRELQRIDPTKALKIKKISNVTGTRPKLRNKSVAKSLGYKGRNKTIKNVPLSAPEYGLYRGQFHLPMDEFSRYLNERRGGLKTEAVPEERGNNAAGGARRRHKTRRHKSKRSHKTRRH
jgi:hypothetical protein